MTAVKVALLKSEGFADAQTRAAKQHGQRAKPETVRPLTDRAHDLDDLFDRRRIGRVLLALVTRWPATVIAGHGRGRAAVPGGVQQHGFHESSYRTARR
jgi:hypothetical protein